MSLICQFSQFWIFSGKKQPIREALWTSVELRHQYEFFSRPVSAVFDCVKKVDWLIDWLIDVSVDWLADGLSAKLYHWSKGGRTACSSKSEYPCSFYRSRAQQKAIVASLGVNILREKNKWSASPHWTAWVAGQGSLWSGCSSLSQKCCKQIRAAN